MGVDYEIYHRPTKEYACLGRWLMTLDPVVPPPMIGRTYQLPKARLRHFIESHSGVLEIVPDFDECYEDIESGWVRVDDWKQKRPERFKWDDSVQSYRSLETDRLEVN